MKTITHHNEEQIEALTSLCGVTYNTDTCTYGSWKAEDGYHYKIIVTAGPSKGCIISTWLGGYSNSDARDKALQENVKSVATHLVH